MHMPKLTSFDLTRDGAAQAAGVIRVPGVCGLLFLCGVLLGSVALAVPPTSPVILTINEDYVQRVPASTSNQSRINAFFEAYVLPSILDGLQYPADPITTADFEVRSSADLSNAVAGDGRRIYIRGPANGGQSTYPQFNLSHRSDIEIVMDNDATIRGGSGWRWDGPVRRLRWTGGNIEFTSSGDGLVITDLEDGLFDDTYWFKDGPSGHILLWTSGNRNFRRIVLMNSTIEFRQIGNSIDYGIFLAGASNGSSGDWLFLGNHINGQGPPSRMQWLGTRTAIVGNYFRDSVGPNSSVRVHETLRNFWFHDNVHVHGGGTQPSLAFQVSSQGSNNSYLMDTALIEDNRFFANRSSINSGSIWRLGDPVASNQDQAINWTIRNNTWNDSTSSSDGSTFGGIMIAAPYVEENNVRVGPGHSRYVAAPSPSGYGAMR